MFSKNKLSIAILTALSAPGLAMATEISPIHVVDKEVASQQEILTKEELTQTGNTETGQILRQVNGVDATRMGGHGLDVQIRGQQNTQLNIILDGAEIAGGCPNRMDPPTSYAEIASYDDVTVIKGVQSVQYGAGGTGGTVIFERTSPTFEEDKPFNGEISAATGSNGLTQDLNAKVEAGNDEFYVVLQGSKKSADNYEDGNGDEVRSSYESQQGHIDLGWRPDANNEFKFSYEKSRTDDALYEGAGMDAPLSKGEIKRLSYEGKNLAKNLQGLEVEVYQSNVDHVMNNFELRMPMDSTKLMETPSTTETTGGKITLTTQLGHTTLDYGLILQSEIKEAALYNRYPDPDALLFRMWPDVLTEQNSVFAESTSLFRDNQKVILGLRYDQVTAEARNTNMMSTNLYTNANSDYSGDTKVEEGNWNALARYERGYKNGWNSYIGLSHTTRTADATERFMNKGGMNTADWWVGNPDLNPEKHNQLDMGLSQNAKHYDWSLSAFYDQVEDYILNTKNASGSSVYVNKDATLYGMEMAGTYYFNHAFKAGFNAALTQGENTTDNDNLINMTPLSGNVFAEYQTSQMYAGGRFNFATAQNEVYEVVSEIETPAWSTVDLYAGYNVNNTFTLSAGIDNLFDHAYYNHINRIDSNSGSYYNVMEPGRNVWAKVAAKF
ncbi:MAG: TonB-dependent copper receptor [Thiomicrorhabdus chilensis]|uniref:TonB-dependent copper receptor n=1 Tax=Thiomicrorhabdus chilensis TaxID=63656 RepID=UPI00299DD88B|nr:TonB-dependent copper receptor [Thiomicrorhabdus chilensis]MDX1346995.1 TonB-dependent copper receptor [Thiomicrorhabdus chilensis]